MIETAAAAAINHLLQTHDWARERLRPFAGKRLEFRLPPLPHLHLVIADSGLVQGAGGESGVDLVVSATAGALPRLLLREQASLDELDIAGPAELAAAVRSLCRDLEWDIEEDLSRLIGDIAAHRLAGGARDLLAWQQEAAWRLARNVTEYLTEERGLLVGNTQAAEFRRDVEAVRAACDRLEDRILVIEARAAQPRR